MTEPIKPWNQRCGWPKTMPLNEVEQAMADEIDELRAALAQQGEPVAWADDAAISGKSGNVCSNADKRYWEKSDWVDRKNAELLKHPLYAGPSRKISDEQILRLVDTHFGGHTPSYPLDKSDWIEFARAIEAHHGIKEKSE